GHLVVVSAFALAMAWYGIGYFENATQLFMVSAAIQVSHRWLAASVPVCGLVMCLHLLSGLALVEQKEFVPEEDE
ncbi:MAG: TRAP transporter small permease, partial [Gammaproteobacteria bacterium]|nr:TRAP transporter small permease [Gammaproteobacteria bacterium]NIR83926.1 TRAP transporter small permease [Gammaproteobacteria bacterium]NIR88921.1 TRAP transporter small permease [Gammaproteobacteria bacterium]NIU04137.1 TRAP transporter small permease [Gammaproteobacteria bacterium]NIV74152.1 TRAP transporter small permease [Gammaproteobacteria bacterium]